MNQKSSMLKWCPGLWAIAGWAGGTSRELRNSPRVRWCQERQLRNWQQAMFGSALFSRQVWCVLFAIKRNYTVYCWFCWLGRECPHPWSWILAILPRRKECYLQIHRPLQSHFLVKKQTKKKHSRFTTPTENPNLRLPGPQTEHSASKLLQGMTTQNHLLHHFLMTFQHTHTTVYF